MIVELTLTNILHQILTGVENILDIFMGVAVCGMITLIMQVEIL